MKKATNKAAQQKKDENKKNALNSKISITEINEKYFANVTMPLKNLILFTIRISVTFI